MTKLIQRSISLVVLVAMLATLFCGFPVTAEEATEETTEVVRDITEKEEEFLLHLGILKTAGPHQEMETTRSGLAQLASRVAKLPEYTGTDKFFTDVPEDHKHYKEIYAMASAGILNGDGNGKFRPDEPVTPNEICKVFLVILGYDVIGYYDNYTVIANRIGLTEGIEFSGNVRIGQMLRMIMTTFDLPMMEQITYGDRDEHKVQDGFTALERYHGLVKQRGVVKGANGTRLTDADISIGQNQLIIGNRVFLYEDTKDLLGREVVFYSQRDKMTGGTKQEIEFLYEDTARNHYLTLNGKDVQGLNEDKLEYYVGSKKKSVQVSSSMDVILNGVAYPEYTPAELKPACGTITLLDNNDDRIYDVILIEEYIYMMVDSIDQEEGIIYGRYPAISVGSQTQNEQYQVYMEAGIEGELNYLSSGDMIAVQASKNTKGSRVVTVTYLGEGVSGVLESIYKDTYTIDGVAYEVTDATAMDEDPYLLGQTVTVYTYNGHCAAIIHPKNDNYKFGYLIDAKVKASAFSGTLWLRIVNQNRELMELATDKKFMLDESECNDASRAYAQIQAAAAKRKFSDAMQAGYESASADNISRTDVKSLYTDGVIAQIKQGDDNFPLSQPVRYRLNDEGVLTHLDTIIKGENETSDSLIPYQQGDTPKADSKMYESQVAELDGAMFETYSKSFYKASSSNAGTLKATMMSTANIIMPPCSERDKVEWYGIKSLTNLSELCYAVELYTVNKYQVARYAVVYNKETIAKVENERHYYILGDIQRMLDEDGEVIRQVTMYGYQGPHTLLVADDIPDSQLEVGSLVRYDTDAENKIAVIEKVYSVSEGDPAEGKRIWEPEKTSGDRPWGKRYRVVYGTTLAHSDGILSHVTSVGDSVWKNDNFRNYKTTGTSVYRYTEESGSPKVELAGLGDLIPYDTDPSTTQRAIMITYSNRLDVVYIIDK